MSKQNGNRSGCKDVFHAFLVSDARYDGYIEIPVIKPEDIIPNRLISFSKAMLTDDYDQWVHFYEDDANFERVWNNPKQYLDRLSKFRGIITPDFSLYRDMPLVMQEWNTYRGKALGSWWQSQGLKVLPNVRFADERSLSFCCNGIAKGSIICIGSHGCLHVKQDREYFKKGLEEVIKKLRPTDIMVYGCTPADVFGICEKSGIRIHKFESEFSLSRKKEGA